MVAYKVPEEFFFRIHHVRPRFKSDIENVLIYMAEKITAIGECPRDKFVERIDDAILSYSGNAGKTKKTINNWRTEISALFGIQTLSVSVMNVKVLFILIIVPVLLLLQ